MARTSLSLSGAFCPISLSLFQGVLRRLFFTVEPMRWRFNRAPPENYLTL